MNFLQNATDDQMALMGCFAALIASAGLMYVSAFLNRAHRQSQNRDTVRTLRWTERNDRPKTTIESPRKVA